MKRDYYYLTSASLILISSGSVHCKIASINWKRLEPNPCVDAGLKGFKLIGTKEYQVFLTETEEDFADWMLWLSKLCILSNITDSYWIAEQIGTGAFSEVRLGIDKHSGDTVAIKYVSKKSNSYEASLKEVDLMRRLKHDSILKLIAVYDCPFHLAIVTERAQGGTLYQFIRRHKIIDESLAKQFMVKFLKAIKHCHSLKCVHRDLKLDNILLSLPEDILSFKIADFGLSCDLEREVLGKRCGSAGYIAPEIILDRPQTAKVDIFSAGVICHILLSGTAPFNGATENKVLVSNVKCRIDLTLPCWDHISETGKDFVAKLLKKDALIRPSIEEALSHPWLGLRMKIPQSPSGIGIVESPILHSKPVNSHKLNEAAGRKEKSHEGIITALDGKESSTLYSNSRSSTSNLGDLNVHKTTSRPQHESSVHAKALQKLNQTTQGQTE
eukprot:CAMPEP_0204913822 /NCGR_PEP_ID=MMETSP1397-20131031/11685_1 /ASSEMBLY_ACC=CAM_ASM_000891 /TAXON_ID=49980 /ORGANISM="Climacostomum Climacostomum virens, Strain Stock W-24" /LENGTH=441 /DNA_ID=CAMNT_0052085153 /DNA_START=36 /DNA_END=1358 /DNA_ORIENTATION=+